jgi:DNA-binding transcriptional MerR regulator
MRGIPTAQAAKIIGVTTRTLFRWIDVGLLPEPYRMKLSNQQSWFLWSAKDIARARKLKAQMKRGPKSKGKKT